MKNVNLFLKIFKTKLNLLFHVYFLGIVHCISAEGLLVTIQKFRIRVQHCHCSSLSLHGLQNVWATPVLINTPFHTCLDLPKCKGQIYQCAFGEEEIICQGAKRYFTVCCLSKEWWLLAPSVHFRRVGLILACHVLCGILQGVTLLVVAQGVMLLVG